MITFIYPPIPLDKTGLATEAEQIAQTALLTTIEANQDSQTSILTDIESNQDTQTVAIQDVEQAVQDLIAKTAGSLVTEEHDAVVVDYSTFSGQKRMHHAYFKTGGTAGTTVATLTFAYDGDADFLSVEKS